METNVQPTGGAEADRINALWRAEYQAAFIAHATSRGWHRHHAKMWASEIVDEASILHWDAGPVEAAQADVAECERESVYT